MCLHKHREARAILCAIGAARVQFILCPRRGMLLSAISANTTAKPAEQPHQQCGNIEYYIYTN